MPTIKASTSELNLKAVLLNGQCFRWRSLGEDYYGVVKGCLLRLRRKDDESVEWSCLGHAPNTSHDSIPEKLHDYFQLDVALNKLWEEWCSQDAFMSTLVSVEELRGIRILKQDPLETLLAFVCSANNNIPRISSMVNKLAKLYGDPIALHPNGDAKQALDHFPELGYAFPTLPQLSAAQDELETALREHLFGYRAKSISETVRQLSEMHPTALTDVQSLPLEKIRKFLLRFAGVGPKVAECVALMSLGQHQCVPIDRHVFEITKTYFMPSLNGSKLTISLSRRLMEFYEVKFGAYAGWAQAVLFNQQLEKFVHSPLGTNEGKIKATRRAVNVKPLRNTSAKTGQSALGRKPVKKCAAR